MKLAPPLSEPQHHLQLKALVQHLHGATLASGNLDHVVTHLSSDSREIQSGGLFVASVGSTWDGHRFLTTALEKGALALVAQRLPSPEEQALLTQGQAWLVVPDAGLALAELSAAAYGHPGQHVQVLATTGTNGKSTTSFLLASIFEAAHIAAGLFSTIENRLGDLHLPTIFTTPPAPEFQRLLATLRDANIGFAIAEASSHGLHQYRIAAFPVAAGGFTNLSRDHLDYHADMADYEAAKARLFDTLAERAAINIDNEAGLRMAQLMEKRGKPCLTLSPSGKEADLSAHAATSTLEGLHATLHFSAKAQVLTKVASADFSSPLIGRHNLENTLVALGMALSVGIPLETCLTAFSTATGAPGRIQRIFNPTASIPQPAVFVDYAHSPDALTNVLSALRPLCTGRLFCVFGAGGDRDRGKRPEMTRAAAAFADRLILTSDNPRTEDPNQILADLASGLSESDQARTTSIENRAEAIRYAISQAQHGDAVLIAGKGHEDYQIIGTTKHPFDDRLEAAQALKEVLA